MSDMTAAQRLPIAEEETDPVWEFAHHIQKCRTCRACSSDAYVCHYEELCLRGQDLRKKLEAFLEEPQDD